MKKYFLIVVAVFALLLPVRFARAEEVIRDFTVDANLTSDRGLTITEQITYDFGEDDRHGIFRYIPESFVRNGVRHRLRLEVLRVERDDRLEPYEAKHQNGQLSVKIGDPALTINGVHTYKITYQTERAVTFHDTFDELYWNVTGNEWPVTIEQASFALHLPSSAANVGLQTVCYTGPFGSTDRECDISSNGLLVTSRPTRILHTNEGFTVAVGFPKGIIAPLSPVQRFWMLITDNALIALPFIALIVMVNLWWRKGRDPHRSTVVPMYEPPQKLSPAEVAAMTLDGGMPKRAVTATLLDLANRGYLHIRSEEEKKLFGKKYTFTFVKRKEADANLDEHERLLFEGVFVDGDETKPEDLALKHKYYLEVRKAEEAVWKKLAAKGLFDKRPALVRASYIGVGILSAVVIGLLFIAYPLVWLGALGTAAVIMLVGWYMPRRTPKGAKLAAEIKGFEWFLSVTEKDRLDFHNAPERTPKEFHELLSYAVALQVEKKWAKQFEDITLPQPEWAEGSGWSSINAAGFATRMSTLSMSAGTMSSPPGSSGGGSSGGGGGGGGGGSW